MKLGKTTYQKIGMIEMLGQMIRGVEVCRMKVEMFDTLLEGLSLPNVKNTCLTLYFNF